MSNSRRRGFLAAVTLATALVVAGAPAASATAKPEIKVSGGVTQPVFSYQDAIREHVRVQSPVDSDGDGKKDLVRVDIIRPKESGSGLKVPVIMHESPYYDNPGVGFEAEQQDVRRERERDEVPDVLRQLLRAARVRVRVRRHDRHQVVRRLPDLRRRLRRARRQGGRSTG